MSRRVLTRRTIHPRPGDPVLYEHIVRPTMFRLDPERAHHLALHLVRVLGSTPSLATALRHRILGSGREPLSLLGLSFEHRVGLAAGFDKDARALWGLYGLGFAFIEVGSVSARPWPGNPKPRIFRLPHERALINRMGLPSEGAEAVANRLRHRPPVPIFVNITRTADPSLSRDDGIEDVCRAITILAPFSDAIVLNLSCPNTRDGCTFQDPEALETLLRAIRHAGSVRRPLLVKVAPDLPEDSLDAVANAALRCGVQGFVATNTTRSRDGLPSPPPGGWPEGGLSGPPLRQRALAVVRRLRGIAGPHALIVGCGGIESREDVERFREVGADLVEAYTGFVYGGPLFCRKVLGTTSSG